ncbi:MAG: hypothetical protein CL678_03730 [Bdellovibrionaceae bacterium]|nr:hypothetical protein [Pseudobdellovibrionaceae bacterium]|tara:strand:+ start:83 stop:481 length:399 start_codon:yes stop_codon:yes gene_type:complete
MLSAQQNDFFKSVPPNDYFGLFGPEGQPDAQKITDLLRYRRKDVSVASDIPLNKVRLEPTRIPRELLERVAEWGVALNLVGNFFKDKKKTILWFQTPNPMLGNMSPREMIKVGRFKKLLTFIQTALEEGSTE